MLVPQQQSKSIGQEVKERLIRRIISGILKPNERIKEIETAKELGVSRASLREAIIMLEREGFIETNRYKNNIIAAIDLSATKHVLIPMRCQIELYALEKFMQVSDMKHYEYLEYLIHNMEWAAKQNNLEQVVDLDIRFHEYIMVISNSYSLISVWTSISNRIRMYYFNQATFNDQEFNIIVDCHKDLLKSIISGDVEYAKSTLRTQIESNIIN